MKTYTVTATPLNGEPRTHTGPFADSIEATMHGLEMLADVEGQGRVQVVAL